MCNLYSLNKNKNTVATMFRVAHNRTVHIDPLPGIFPNYTAPVVRHAADGEREMALMSWGFPLLQAGKAPRRVTNVRDDKILTSSFWRSSFEQRRCLVPATSFCEPNGDVKPATWHSLMFVVKPRRSRWLGPKWQDGLGRRDRQARRGAERKASVDQSLIRGLGVPHYRVSSRARLGLVSGADHR